MEACYGGHRIFMVKYFWLQAVACEAGQSPSPAFSSFLIKRLATILLTIATVRGGTEYPYPLPPGWF